MAGSGRTVCAMHGGKTPRGAALPQFKHGRYSKDLPERLQERYETARTDEERLALTEEIALIDARLGDVLKRVDKGDGGRLWPQVASKFNELRTVLNDAERFVVVMRELGELIGRGSADYAAWREAYDLLEVRRKLVESERKRMLEAQQFVSVEKVMVYTAAVVDALTQAIKFNLPDQRLGSLILADTNDRLRRLLANPGPSPDRSNEQA
jgi:hypothetical protein